MRIREALLHHLSPEMQVLVTVLGAAVAAMAHGSKLAVRGLVTPSPEPVSNISLSSVEDIVAIGLTWVATHHPWVAAGFVVAMLVLAGVMVRTLLRVGRRMWVRWSERNSSLGAGMGYEASGIGRKR